MDGSHSNISSEEPDPPVFPPKKCSQVISYYYYLERVQKMAMRVIFKKQYASYQKSLQSLKLDTLEIRRQKLNMKFAKGCLKIDKLCPMFPVNEVNHNMEKRCNEKYKVNHAKTERYRQSSIPYLQRLLNSE